MSHADAKARQAELAKLFAATAIGVREARAKRLNTARRLMFLLSGLVTCGTFRHHAETCLHVMQGEFPQICPKCAEH